MFGLTEPHNLLGLMLIYIISCVIGFTELGYVLGLMLYWTTMFLPHVPFLFLTVVYRRVDSTHGSENSEPF